MGVRDEEIKRILLYAKGLGIKVSFKESSPKAAAEWTHDPVSEITIYRSSHGSKTELILSLLHELSHNKYYMLSGKKPLSEALLLENERKSSSSRVIPKRLRKEIASFEIESLALMTNIAIELDLKLSMWKILAAQELDRWQFEVYLATGNFPTFAQNRVKKEQVVAKYKPSHNKTK